MRKMRLEKIKERAKKIHPFSFASNLTYKEKKDLFNSFMDISSLIFEIIVLRKECKELRKIAFKKGQ